MELQIFATVQKVLFGVHATPNTASPTVANDFAMAKKVKKGSAIAKYFPKAFKADLF